MKCLVVEDEPETLRYIRHGLEEALYAVTPCDNSVDALHYVTTDNWDLVIVDRLLPGGIDGLVIVRKLRDLGKTTSVVVISALAGAHERVRGLREGADDYLSKPFAITELLARVEALRRRQQLKFESPLLQVADLTLDTSTFLVKRGTTSIALQPREFRLLVYLMRHEGQVVTRTMLLEAVWGCHFASDNDVLDVQMSRLRGKVDKGFMPPLIHTVRGVGYLLGQRP
jgi:two-component system, OmpR family, response regulator